MTGITDFIKSVLGAVAPGPQQAFAILKAVLALATAVAEHIREKSLMDAGESKAVARELAALAGRLGIANETRAAVEAMSDDDLDAALKGD